MTQVCFYTANVSFRADTFDQYFKQCYYYEIENYISTYRGVFLKQFTANGYQMTAFGEIGGPYLYNNLFLYSSTPLYTYRQQPALILEIGTTTGGVGQDYHVWSPTGTETGDYYGSSVTAMSKDNQVNEGYDNSGLVAKFWNAVPASLIAEVSTTNLLINFQRIIDTHDNYDRKLLSTFSFCLYVYATGSINGELTDKTCEVVELSYQFQRTYLLAAFGSKA